MLVSVNVRSSYCAGFQVFLNYVLPCRSRKIICSYLIRYPKIWLFAGFSGQNTMRCNCRNFLATSISFWYVIKSRSFWFLHIVIALFSFILLVLV